MRRVAISSLPKGKMHLVTSKDWGIESIKERAVILKYRHRYDDSWYKEIIKELDLKDKCITPSRVRRLIVGALFKGEEIDKN